MRPREKLLMLNRVVAIRGLQSLAAEAEAGASGKRHRAGVERLETERFELQAIEAGWEMAMTDRTIRLDAGIGWSRALRDQAGIVMLASNGANDAAERLSKARKEMNSAALREECARFALRSEARRQARIRDEKGLVAVADRLTGRAS